MDIPSTAQALTILRRHQLPQTFAAAQHYLHWHREAGVLLHLYRIYFPEEYARSTASPAWDPASPYSPHEFEFLRLIDRRLFPLPIDDLLDVDDDTRFPYVPIIVWGLGDWPEGDLTYLRTGWQLLIPLIVDRRYYAPDFSGSPVEELIAMYEDTIRRDPIDWTALEAACADRPEPWPALPTALAVLTHDTGNIWLDPYWDGYPPPEDLPWCQATLDWLTTEFAAAQRLTATAERFLDWLETDPAHYAEVITLWNQLPARAPSPPWAP